MKLKKIKKRIIIVIIKTFIRGTRVIGVMTEELREIHTYNIL